MSTLTILATVLEAACDLLLNPINSFQSILHALPSLLPQKQLCCVRKQVH